MASMWASKGVDIYIVGLTGGIASGKSEVSNQLKKLGAYVIDADEVARDIVRPGLPAYEEILSHFGDRVLDESGNLDRERLGELVFEDPGKRDLLNRITHPRIFEEITRRVLHYTKGPDPLKIAVVDAALIVDVGAEKAFDCVVVVVSEPEVQIGRLVELRKMAGDEARNRVESQIDNSERIAKADLVIENNGSIDELKEKIRELWEEILKRAEEGHS